MKKYESALKKKLRERVNFVHINNDPHEFKRPKPKNNREKNASIISRERFDTFLYEYVKKTDYYHTTFFYVTILINESFTI